MQSFTGVLLAQLLNATNRTDPNKLMSQSAYTVGLSCFCTDMCHSSIAQVTMSSWLPCSLEQLSWTLQFFWLLAISLVLNLKQVSISLLLKS